MNSQAIIRDLKKRINGRMAGSEPGENYPLLMEVAVEAGNGNILEIGTLYGASAIAMALARREAGLTGIIVCIDKFDEYRKEELTPKMVFDNAELYSLNNLLVLPLPSHPLPPYASLFDYVLVHIDGDHEGKAPLNDWLNVKDLATRFVVFHDRTHPAVRKAINTALEDENWRLYKQGEHTLVLERIAP